MSRGSGGASVNEGRVMSKPTINSWVVPDSVSDRGEVIVGRVVRIGPLTDDLTVAWLSNERGLWVNDEYALDVAVIEPPSLGVIEAIMVSAHPTHPHGYEA